MVELDLHVECCKQIRWNHNTAPLHITDGAAHLSHMNDGYGRPNVHLVFLENKVSHFGARSVHAISSSASSLTHCPLCFRQARHDGAE